MSDSLVIIPTFNEKENVEAMIHKIFSLQKHFHILVVDDNSPDGTANIVKSLQPTYPESLFLLERKGKLGLGTAYIAGFKYGLSKNYDYIKCFSWLTLVENYIIHVLTLLPSEAGRKRIR